MLKVLLINTYLTRKESERVYPLEPLGLLCLATYLKKEAQSNSLKNIDIKIFDAQMEGGDKTIIAERGYRSGIDDLGLIKFVKKYKPDIVGISNNYTTHLNDVLEISKTIKEIIPRCLLFLGGAHATIDHENLIKFKWIDGVVRGEGEITFKEIVFSVYFNKNLSNIKGLTFKKENRIFINKERELIEDINTLPIPDRNFLDYKKYLEKTPQIYFSPMNSPIGTIFTARGCPFNCIFCSTQKVWKNKWRPRSPEKIFDEINYLIKTFGVKEISLEDDQFMFSKERIKNLCNLIIKNKLNITLIVPSGISPSLIDIETMQLMKKAGFYRLCFSIDVGTPLAKNFVRKPVNLGKMRDLIKKANHLGFFTYATFVIGFPFEKEEDIQKTIDYSYNLKLDFLRFYIAQPHLGSDLYDIYLKEGLINKTVLSEHHTMFDSSFGTKYLSKDKVLELRDEAENNYLKSHINDFFNFNYLFYEFLPKIKNINQFVYLLKMFKNFSDTKKK